MKCYIIALIVLAGTFFMVFFKPSNSSIETVREVYRDTIIKVDSFYLTDIQTDTIIQLHTDTFVFEGHKVPMSEYHYPINDSLLKGTIIAKAPFKPVIDFKYTLESYTLKDSVYIEKTPLNGFYYGAEVMAYPLLSQMFLSLDYQNKKGAIIGVAVGRDFIHENNLIKLSYKKRF
tara:strand:- start:2536 stop:3060 length:525 start_codon:yes stop_codon:yes gene_type:complete